MNDGEALLRAVLDAPNDIRPRLVYADWLEEHGEPTGALRLRWWTRTAPLFAEDLDRPGPAGDGGNEPCDRGRSMDWRLKRLGCVLLARTAEKQCRVPWSKIDGWPEGWNSKRCRAAIAEALHAAEWYALGLETDDGLVSATARVAAAEMGCSGRTAHRRLREWEELGVWGRLHADLLRLPRRADKLDPDVVIVDSVFVRAFGGGEQTGPSPVGRRKSGTKHTLLVDRHGAPLAIRTAGANASDHTQIIPVVLDFPKVGGKPGRPKEMPDELYAGRGYDSEATRWLLRWMGIEPHIAKRRTPHGSGLGKARWVVGRTISWLKGLRRMRVRYDRLGVIRDAFTTLAAGVICFRLLHDDEPLAA